MTFSAANFNVKKIINQPSAFQDVSDSKKRTKFKFDRANRLGQPETRKKRDFSRFLWKLTWKKNKIYLR